MAGLGGRRTGRFGMFPQRGARGRSRRHARPLTGLPAAGTFRAGRFTAGRFTAGRFTASRFTASRFTAGRLLVAALVSAGLALVATPATGAPSPPDVTGRTLSDARQILAAAGVAHVVTVPAHPVAADGDTVVTGHEAVPLGRGVEAELRVRARVPSVVGTTVAEATRLMASVGLVACPDDDAGTVVAQVAPAGSVLPFGAAVGLTVASDGGVPRPPVVPVVVPSLLGMSADEAAAVLAGVGLRLEQRLRGAGAAGPVQDQEPAAGTRVGPGSLVTLVAQGERLAPGFSSVPEVRGLELDEARARLAEAGLSLRVAAQPADLPVEAELEAFGPVREQDPEPGAEVEAGSTVTAVVDRLVAVPDLHGLDLDAAATLLARVGLTLATLSDVEARNADGERVTGQTPEPEALVTAGSAVAVTVTDVAGPSGYGPRTPPVDRGWWWLVVLVVLVVTLAVLLLLRGARHGRWVAAHVSAIAHPVPAAVTVLAAPGAPPSLRVRVVPVPGPLDDVQVRQVEPE